ncbi:uncharacterized protein Z518_07536 [Rhinocladiella mackenziei CBS 650.93]|uniref:Zn(2)-C6 fungal-type domain-containing protein n=1 Tax=Rhinocladiella mackenziei CBS 650.93 TaxID=1442369 RepID=A0A0D2H0P3_9EURO|nr:uncharacterized protein Z518_07536 [Rhinocladiella mackenziei CBS 650.93]KIX03983.1 hypothetical protein Z518_07536 [Rhinocladiella mackenziei CBS 650.93]
MPAKVVKPKASSAVRRSRTGCQTCRSRKLKCDEARPVCGQCQKSRRQCVRSEGITFRHHQNATFDRDNQDNSLDRFFKNAQSYSAEELASFLPVPQQLTWVYVSDPNAEETDTTPPPQTPNTSDTFRQVAAHTLEALSTAAADHVSYPPQGTAYYTAATPPNESNPEYGFVRVEAGTGIGGQTNNNINFLLNPQGQTHSSLIDPNLEATVAHAAEQADMKAAENKTSDQHNQEQVVEDDGLVDSDSRVAMALRSFNETPA